MSVDTMLIVELMEWIEEREDSSAWELAEELVEYGWVTAPPKDEGEGK